MATADDVEQKGLHTVYGAAKLSLPNKEWTPEDISLLTGLALIIYSTVGSTYYYWSLLPAWEADAELGWTRSTTSLVTWGSTLMEVFGLLVAGPLADYLEPLQLILLEGSCSLIGLVLTALFLTSPNAIVADVLLVNFLKGILWPAVGATVFKSIAPEKQDVMIFCAALASRFAGGTGEVLVGFVLNLGFRWRAAGLAVAGVTLAMLVAGFAVLKKFLVQGIHESEDQAGAPPLWVATYGAKWHRLATDLRSWLVLVTMIGAGTVWSLAGYLSVLLKQQFDLSSGEAAMGASSVMMGIFLGLLTAGLVAFRSGRDAGRSFQLIQGVIGSFFTLLIAIFPNAGLPWTLSCLILGGMCAGPLLYLPYTSYSAVMPKSQRAFCMGTLDCLSQVTQALTKMYFGHLRVVFPDSDWAGHVMFDVFATGQLMAVATTGVLYRHLRGEDSEVSTF
mmetsp:Transcript_28031/g.52557  ORF Transcript_28031/g.52557 Transcript_28031/m.52557 type:complete len:448 (-) Transcript_28031:97-1440(-)